MFKKFGDLSIRNKLMSMMLLTCSIVLCTAVIAISLSDAILFQVGLKQNQKIMANIIGGNTAAAVAFNDQKSAEETLGRLQNNPHIMAAFLLINDNRIFASYIKKGLTSEGLSDLPITRAPDGEHIPPAVLAKLARESEKLMVFDGDVDTVIPYFLDGQKICTIFLKSDLGELKSRFYWLMIAVALIMTVSLMIAYALSAKLQRFISEPLFHLLETMKVVSQRDYTVRATRESNDELGQLITGFNEMLVQIELRDAQLERQHGALEERVAQRTEELLRAKDAAEAASRAKSQFLANMSHEIRTPMNGVLGTTELLLESSLTQKQRSFAEMIRSSGESLLSIINDILDFSKIEAGKMELESVPFCLRATVEEAVGMLAEKAHRKGLELASLIDRDVPDGFTGDPGRLRQILVNLIGNAVKFTEQGEVVVKVKSLARDGNSTLVHCEVRDSGIGIAPEAQSRIFEQFSQADDSMTRKFGGTGLGLAIVKQLVELKEGELGVESEEGAGTTFWFQFRLREQPVIGSLDGPRLSLQGLRVLLVDDNAVILRILQQEIINLGMRCDTAMSGEEALALFDASRKSPYDLAILDLVMPGMDGVELARTIKRDPEGAKLRMLMLTSFGKEGDQERAHTAGIDCYLTKPVRQMQLINCIASLLGVATDAEITPAAPEKAPFLGDLSMHILLVEDNAVNRDVCSAMLESLSLRVTTAENGRLALNELARTNYDLVLMDCQMPEMDGYQATGCIREKERLSETARHLPIIALTAHALEGDRERCLYAGMDDYLTKPLSKEKLRQALGRWLTGRGAASAGEAASPDALPVPTAKSVEGDAAAGAGKARGWQAVIDETALDSVRTLQRVGSPSLLNIVISRYLEESPRLIDAMRQALSEEDPAGLRLAAHSFKSSSAYLGVRGLIDLCQEMEALGRDQATAGAGEVLAKIETEFACADQALSALREVECHAG